MSRPFTLLGDRRTATAAVVALVTALMSVLLGSPAQALPPNIPSASTAQYELNSLTVRSEYSMSGYSRDKFPHWTSSGGCSTRERVLIRDGNNVSTDSNCYPTSGSWYSYYDGVTLYSASGVDIDHTVPLAEAWRSGAKYWSTSSRRSYANDLGGPELIAVSASSNRSKGDQDPDSWMPRYSFRCTYARMYIHSKYYWGMSVDSAERDALQYMLNTC